MRELPTCPACGWLSTVYRLKGPGFYCVNHSPHHEFYNRCGECNEVVFDCECKKKEPMTKDENELIPVMLPRYIVRDSTAYLLENHEQDIVDACLKALRPPAPSDRLIRLMRTSQRKSENAIISPIETRVICDWIEYSIEKDGGE